MPVQHPIRKVAAAALTGSGLLLSAGAYAQLKRAPPPRPAGWKPGQEVRAAASGPVRQVREFVWGQKLEPATGVFRLRAVDNTWDEDPNSQDALKECVARVRIPATKNEYYIRFTRLIPVGHRRLTMGGVLTNHDLFGNTEIGGPGLFPRLRASVAVWGYANVVKNGKVIGRDRRAFAWVGQGARSAEGKWLYQADPAQTTAHLIVWGTLGNDTPLPSTRDGFLHFEWPVSQVNGPNSLPSHAAAGS